MISLAWLRSKPVLQFVNHGGGVVDGHNRIIRAAHLISGCEGGASQAAAQIIDRGIFLAVALCKDPNHGDNRTVARHGAVNHVLEDIGDFFIEDKISRQH